MQNSHQPPEPVRPKSAPNVDTEHSQTVAEAPCAAANTRRSRREFLVETTALSAGIILSRSEEETATAAPLPQAPPATAGQIATTLQINGRSYPMQVEPRVSLLDAIREEAHLTGTKKGCDHGQCGACTVHIEGRRVLSCMTLAVMHEGQQITTIEGLAEGEKLHPMQAAFLSHDGFQCGFCTPGQIMSAVGMVQEGHAHSDDEIREAMSGNLCRCGAYSNILSAIRSAQEGKTDASV